MEIEDLPEEILLKIFGFLKLQDIVLNVRLVCKQWQYLASDSQLWKESECIVESTMENRDIIEFLKHAAGLRHLVLRKVVSPRVFIEMYAHNPHLTTITIHKNQTLSCNVLKNLITLCSNLRNLSIPVNTISKDSARVIEAIGKLKHLQSLSFKSHDYSESCDIKLKPITHGCASLKQLDIDLFAVEEYDLQNFLTETSSHLLSLRIRIAMCGFHSTRPLKNNTNLRELCFVGENDEEIDENSLKPIRTLKHLQALRMGNILYADPQFLADNFYFGSLRFLVKFELCWIQDATYDCIVRAVCSNCPLVEELGIYQDAFSNNVLLSDYGLELLPELVHLRDFVLSIEKSPTNVTADIIGKCKLLNNLKIRMLQHSCYWPVNTYFHSLKNLRLLELEHCNIEQFIVRNMRFQLPVLNSLTLLDCSGYCDVDIKCLKDEFRGSKVITKYSECT